MRWILIVSDCRSLNEIPSIEGTAGGKQVQGDLDAIASDLELLIDTISQLKIDDLVTRTSIIDSAADVMGGLNRIRSGSVGSAARSTLR
ncbi:MAG: hypothetical protein U0892_08915 [Pirellulales bacterium]